MFGGGDKSAARRRSANKIASPLDTRARWSSDRSPKSVDCRICCQRAFGRAARRTRLSIARFARLHTKIEPTSEKQIASKFDASAAGRLMERWQEFCRVLLLIGWRASAAAHAPDTRALSGLVASPTHVVDSSSSSSSSSPPPPRVQRTLTPRDRLACVDAVCDLAGDALSFFVIGDQGGVAFDVASSYLNFIRPTDIQERVARAMAELAGRQPPEFIISTGDSVGEKAAAFAY